METPGGTSSPWGRPSTQASRDWARRGHSPAAPLSLVVRTRPAPSPEAAFAVPRFTRKLRRTTGTFVLAVVALGSAGSALALRDALFPTVTDATTRSVWQNPAQPARTPTSPINSISPTSSTSTTTSTSTTSSTSTTTSTVTTVDTAAFEVETTAEPRPRSTRPSGGGAPGPAPVQPGNTTPSPGTSDDDGPTGSTTPPTGTVKDDDDQPAVTTVSTGTPPSDGSSPPTTDDDDSSGSGSSGPGTTQSPPTTDDDDSSGSGSRGSGTTPSSPTTDDNDSSGSGSSGSGSDDD